MDEQIRHVVVVGGGLAAAKAVEAARKRGYDGRLTILAAETESPYDRPPLSKGLLLGDLAVNDVYLHPAQFYVEHAIELWLGEPATAIDRGAGQVVTRAGRRLTFDRLLLATGSTARRLAVPGGDLDGVVTLRTLDDSRLLAERLRAVEHVTVVGAGWIGCEVAAAARTLGVQVTMVDPLDVPLGRALGTRIGQVFADLHTDHGVDLRLGAGVVAIHGDKTVEQVALSDGRAVDTQLVVVGIGAVPNTELAEQAGLDVDDGVLVDATLTASDPRVLAAGDVARAWHPLLGQRLRVEHWANALNQGLTAGGNLLGAADAYDRVPYVFTDQYDLGMEYCGHSRPDDTVVVRGSTEAREFVAFWVRDGRLTAGMTVNVWDVTDDIAWLIRSQAPVDPRQLADPDVPLNHLAGRPRSE